MTSTATETQAATTAEGLAVVRAHKADYLWTSPHGLHLIRNHRGTHEP